MGALKARCDKCTAQCGSGALLQERSCRCDAAVSVERVSAPPARRDLAGLFATDSSFLIGSNAFDRLFSFSAASLMDILSCGSSQVKGQPRELSNTQRCSDWSAFDVDN